VDDGIVIETDATASKGCESPSNTQSNKYTIPLFVVDAIELVSFYDPDLLPDHRGDYFKHVHAKLVQLDIRDENDMLIPPWDMYDNLRPGTVVLIDASLVCWHIFAKGRGDKLDRKVSTSLSITIYVPLILCI